MISSRFIHVISCIKFSFLFVAEKYSIFCMYHILLIHSSGGGPLGCFRLCFMHNAVMCIGIQISEWKPVFSSLRCIPRSELLAYMVILSLTFCRLFLTAAATAFCLFAFDSVLRKNKGSFWWGIFYLFFVWLLILLVWYRSHCLHNLKSRFIHILRSL